MTVIRAETLGTCMGVRRALQMVEQALAANPDTPIFTLGPLIHSPRVVEEFRRRGVREVESLEEVDAGIVVVRTHGIGPAERRGLARPGVVTLDATCPNVRRVQELVRTHAEAGAGILIVGDASHGEVIGIRGYAPGAAVISTDAEAEVVPLAPRTLVVSQTTFRRADYRRICSILERRQPGIVIRDTTCAATERRQESLLKLAQRVEAIVVVGGRESANTRWLFRTAVATGKPSWQVESAAELPAEASGFATVGLTAGASAPDALIDEVEQALLAR